MNSKTSRSNKQAAANMAPRNSSNLNPHKSKRQKLDPAIDPAVSQDAHACDACREKDKRVSSLLRDLNRTPPKQRYFDEKSVAKRLGVSVKTLQAWRDRGQTELPFYKFGSLVRYRLRDIVAYEKAARRMSTSDMGDGHGNA